MKKLLHFVLLSVLPALAIAGPGRLQFVPNQGQWSESFLYKSGVRDCDIYLEKNCVTYLLQNSDVSDLIHEYKHDTTVKPILKYHAYRMTFEGASPNVTTQGSEPFTTYYNYYLGNDQSKWKTGVHPFATVTYTGLYPGIDALIKTDNGNFAYDFIIAPNADPGLVKLRFDGADKLELKDGKLLIYNSIKTIEESVPYTYQIVNGEKKEVACKYVLNGSTISFAFPEGYDKNIALVIDPSVVFVTFSGSTSSNYGFSATYDAAGNAYGAGEVFGASYPVTLGAFQTVWGGGSVDINISKYNPDGTLHLFGTFLGGSASDQPHSMIADAAGNLIVTGISGSSNYPVTVGAYDVTFNGGGTDLVVSKFNPSGTALIGSTYMGGTAADGGNMAPLTVNYGDAFRGEVICDQAGNVYVAGNSKSTNFPIVNATQAALSGSMDAVAFKLNGNLSSLLWSTYLGGSGVDGAVVLSLDNDESHVYVSGGTNSTNFPVTPGAYLTTFQGGTVDGYVARYQNGGGFPLQNCTYIGTPAYDQCYGVQVDMYNGVYTMGQTAGAFPVVGSVYSNAGSGQFIMKLDSLLTGIVVSTVFGNGNNITQLAPTAFMVDSCLNIYFSGFGNLTNLPVTPNAFQLTPPGGGDFYFIALGPNAVNLLFGSYYGSTSADHVDGGTSRFDKAGIIYQGICTNAPTYPGSTGSVFPNNGSSWNVVTMKVAFELGIVSAIASANNVSGCGPLTVQFQNTSSNATSFVWDFGDGSPTDTATNPTHIFTTPGVYNVMLAAGSNFACNFTDTTYITVTVDSGGVIGDFTFQIVDSCGPYTATFTNTSTVISTGATYNWNFGDNTTYTGQTPPLHTYPGLGTYTVTLYIHDTGAVCNEYDTVSYTLAFTTFDVAAQATPSPSTQGCAPFVVQFQDNSTNADTYWWDFGDGSPASTIASPTYTYNNAGVYTVTFIASSSSPSACKAADTAYLTITVDTGNINAGFVATVTDSCGSFRVDIVNTSTNVSTAAIYTWDFGDGTSFTGADPLFHDYPGPGTYTITLVVQDVNSCNALDSVSQTITITNLFVDAVAPPLPDECGVFDVNFNHSSTNAQSVQWYLGDGTTSTQNSFTHHYDTTGVYNVVLIAFNELACNKSDTFSGNVRIRRWAIADFHYTPVIPERNMPIDFFNLSQYADTYRWDFGDGTTSAEENPSKLYNKTYLFNVCLTANNSDNCPDTICRTAQTDISPLIDIPTGFSPNGDGMNDILYVRGVGIVTVNLKIFNRWGTLIFESNSMDVGWDGTYSGKEQPMEAYAYVLRATFVNGENFQRQGNVTLIR